MIRTIKENKRNYLSLLGLFSVLMILFYRSFYWADNSMVKRKILEFVIIVFFVLVVPVVITVLKPLNHIVDKFFEWINKTKEYSLNHKRKTIILGLIFIIIAPVCIIISNAFSPNPFVGYTVCAVAYVIYCVVLYRNISGKRPEGLFACVALILGIFVITVTPATPGIMLDDETHYIRVIKLSNSFNGTFYTSEQEILAGFTDVIFDKKTYNKESRDEYYNSLNEKYESKELVGVGVPAPVGIFSISYIPSAIGIIIARGLSMDFIHVFMMGKFFNLLIYILIMYFAIKKLKYGKILFVALGLIPSNIFMASNYSYDSWVFAFAALAFAYFISILQNDNTIETKDIVLMNIFFFLAFMPKAVYVVMMFPLLFMPKKKFKNKKQRSLYYIIAVATVLLLLGSFVIPFTSTGAGEDVRGGSDVSSLGQFSFVLNNMGYFIKVLLGFLKQYTSFLSSQRVLQMYAYLGAGDYYILVLVILFVVAVLDKDNTKEKNSLVRFGGIAGAAFGVIIVALAFYLAFTPVGADTIAGCQPRYLLPTLIPFFYFIVPEGIGSNAKKNWLANTAVLIMSMTFIYNIYNLSVKLYM